MNNYTKKCDMFIDLKNVFNLNLCNLMLHVTFELLEKPNAIAGLNPIKVLRIYNVCNKMLFKTPLYNRKDYANYRKRKTNESLFN